MLIFISLSDLIDLPNKMSVKQVVKKNFRG